VVIPIRSTRSEKIDLALALAVLSKGVKAYERVQRARLALSASSFPLFSVYAHAKSLGA
jgi:hypothetical protein